MTNYFVSRHAGAIEWAKKRRIEAEFVAHIEPDQVKSGDMVLGTLPVNRIAELNAKGVRYLHLVMPLKANDRGTELTAEDMERMGAELVEYLVQKIG